jgi:hypothetical protein
MLRVQPRQEIESTYCKATPLVLMIMDLGVLVMKISRGSEAWKSRSGPIKLTQSEIWAPGRQEELGSHVKVLSYFSAHASVHSLPILFVVGSGMSHGHWLAKMLVWVAWNA